MIEPHDIWLLVGCLGVLIGVLSIVGAMIEREWPIRGSVLVGLGAFGFWRVHQISDVSLTWYEPIEAVIRVYSVIF
ncbi:MAG: hypothetical protein AAF826_05830 [Pseudomonadota bacterium]